MFCLAVVKYDYILLNVKNHVLSLYRIVSTNSLKENQAIGVLALQVIWLFEFKLLSGRYLYT